MHMLSASSAWLRVWVGLCRREGASELMLRLLAANPDLQATRMPLVASLASVRADDVDGAGAARWGGFRVGGLSCEDLDEASLPCEGVSRGFDWGGAGGVVVALVLALLPLAALGLLIWWLRRRRGPSHSHAHEIKSHETDNSMDEMSLDARLEDAKLSGGELEVTKVKVAPYEPDGYDPNNVEKILGDLTTGEQVIKAKVRPPLSCCRSPRPPCRMAVARTMRCIAPGYVARGFPRRRVVLRAHMAGRKGVVRCRS